jgi:hypothetical protein
MITIGVNPEAELVQFARSWFRMLARGDWESALASIDEPNMYGIRWTKEDIVQLLHDTYGPGSLVQTAAPTAFSDPDTASGTERYTVDELDAGGFWLDYDVPLNGEFSDLTAQFEFHPRSSRYAVILHDLHVM